MGIDIGEINKYNEITEYPEVDLIFTGPKKSLVDRVSGNSLQFTRNTIGTYVDANGIIQTAVAGEPRYTYDPATGEELGLMVEKGGGNYHQYSNTFSNTTGNPGINGNSSKWQNFSNVTLQEQQYPDPAGGNTATRVIPNTNNTSHSIGRYQAYGTSIYAHSIFVKPAGYSRFRVTTNTNYFNVNLSGTGSFTSSTDQNLVYAIKIQPFQTGWYRLEWIWNNTGGSGANTNQPLIQIINDSGSLTFAGDGTSGIDFYGYQQEFGSFPTSYISTTSSTVTRDPDTVTLTNNNLYDNSQFDIINDPFGMSSGSDTLTLLPSNSENSAIKRATIFSSNITQTKINTFAKKTDEFWRWRVLGSSFGLPAFTTDGQVTVDWGDGTVETLTTSDHTFTNGGGYHEIGFRLDSGTYFRPTIGGNAAVGDKIYSVGPAPESMKVNATQLFWNCDNLKSVDATFDIVNSANSAFYLCDNLKNIPKVNTTGITNFTNFARSCSSLTSFPLIDTSSGTNFNYAWNNCTSLTSFPLLDTSSGIDFDTAWQNCSSLTSFPLLDTSSGTNFSRAWVNCSSLTSFPLIDTSSGTNYNNTWKGCSSLTSFPLINTSSGTNFTRTWQNCSTLTSFPLIDTSSGTTFSATWVDCSNLTSFPLIDTSSCTTFSNTWQNCSSLTSFPLLDTSSCTTFNDAWYNCSSLTSFPLIDTSSGTNFINAWVNCSSLTSFPLLDTSSGTTFSSTWQGCTSLTSFPLIDTSSGTNFLNAWYNCSSLTNFPANFFDSWTGTPVNNCFFRTWYLCSSLTATSVENILNSIDTSGRSAPASGVDITIDFNASSGTPNISTAVSNLKGRGWTITLNGVAQ